MDKVEKSIGKYIVEKRIGRGGMGEVYLAYDPSCKRQLALKIIRDDLNDNKTIQNRFLREAKIASQLTHPSIIPIYSIHVEPPLIYYTMPYIEGSTFKEILTEIQSCEKKGKKSKYTINELIRIFLNVCEAIAYTHSRGVLHRDLKPGNIMIGKYGEVMIFDWGIANYIQEIKKEEGEKELISNIRIIEKDDSDLTRPGKFAGTLSYLPPERATGQPSSIATDIYALGTILYLLLTLKLPFQRANVKTFKKFAHLERLISPIDRAPYRDIPHELSEIAVKCLCLNARKRYQAVDDLIKDIKRYIEGKPRWIYLNQLDIHKKDNWAFQENVLLAKNVAITKSADITQWVNMMVSKEDFATNVKVEADILLGKWSAGIGFLINIPQDKKTKKIFEDGYLVWLSSIKDIPTYLLRSNVKVTEVSTYLTCDTWHKIRIEKEDDNFKCFLDDILIMSYSSHIPLFGSHIGVILKDSDFILKNLTVFSKSHNIMVNCLAVGDAFLAKKEYDTAIKEYTRIGKSFPGRSEGREAVFRAGFSLLEKFKSFSKTNKKKQILEQALNEFSILHNTPAEPLEYFGKALCFEATLDFEEEAKCLELALRKFKNHIIIPQIKEHVIYRLHESSLQNKESAYRIALISLTNIENALTSKDNVKLFTSLQEGIETPYYIEEEKRSDLDKDLLIIKLCILLKKDLILIERLHQNVFSKMHIKNALFALLELNNVNAVDDYIKSDKNFENSIISITIKAKELPLKDLFFRFEKQNIKLKTSADVIRTLIYILSNAIQKIDFLEMDEIFKKLKVYTISKKDKILLNSIYLKFLLLTKNHDKFKIFVSKYPKKIFSLENSSLYFPYMVMLNIEEKVCFIDSYLESLYPSIYALAIHYLNKVSAHEKKEFVKKLLPYEKMHLYRDLALYYYCINDRKKYLKYKELSE